MTNNLTLCTKQDMDDAQKFIDTWLDEAEIEDGTVPLHDLAQAIANGRRNAWQPINTAPKDGTSILGFGLWAGEIAGIVDVPERYTISWTGGSTDYPGFDWAVEGTDAHAAWLKPTHWMPLPEPPK